MSKFTNIVKAAAAYLNPAYALHLKTEADIARSMQAREVLRVFLADGEDIAASYDREACHRFYGVMLDDDEGLRDSLDIIEKTDSYVAETLADSLQNLRSNLISMVLHGQHWWPAMDEGLHVPDNMPDGAINPPLFEFLTNSKAIIETLGDDQLRDTIDNFKAQLPQLKGAQRLDVLRSIELMDEAIEDRYLVGRVRAANPAVDVAAHWFKADTPAAADAPTVRPAAPSAPKM